MHNPSLLPFLALISTALSTPFLSPRATCTVQSQNYEVYDDAPLINDALRTCGSGGTIRLPDNYSIRSALDLSPCQNCDIQLEGILLMSDDWNAWINKTAYISTVGAKGLTLRSLTGNGLIDGHSQGWFQRARYIPQYPDPREHMPSLVLLSSAQDIRISNLRLIDAPREFFRVDGGNQRVEFSDLTISVRDQWYQKVDTMWESSAFQLRNSSAVHLTRIAVDFRSNSRPFQADGGTGACVMLDWGLDDVSVTDISCHGTYYGVMLQFGGVDMDRCLGPAPEEAQISQNIVIKNYTANSTHNAGFLFHLQYGRPQVDNLTYDTVDFVGGAYLENSVNYEWPNYCRYTWQPQHWSGNYSNVWFRTLSGDLGVPNDKSPVFCKTYGCLNCWMGGACDFHFEGVPVYMPGRL
ncbi:pectin lyase-like protein [Polyplosphaeria fusca]|uniref:Pectin lyase-like protein n=1 Tax=Polyplosphaeria fusca TaxID=682080 RepID=A0A9P4QMC9_9PLEO|nr:pectin lyase-like protein [Polyplosphaeria fusca]